MFAAPAANCSDSNAIQVVNDFDSAGKRFTPRAPIHSVHGTRFNIELNIDFGRHHESDKRMPLESFVQVGFELRCDSIRIPELRISLFGQQIKASVVRTVFSGSSIKKTESPVTVNVVTSGNKSTGYSIRNVLECSSFGNQLLPHNAQFDRAAERL